MKTTENMAQIAIRARVGIHASRELARPCATHGRRELDILGACLQKGKGEQWILIDGGLIQNCARNSTSFS